MIYKGTVVSLYIARLCSKIEIIFGYTKLVERVSCLLTYITSIHILYKLFLLGDDESKRIIVGSSMPSYFENISRVLDLLKDEGYDVILFCEWDSVSFSVYSERVVSEFGRFNIVFDCYRALPLVQSSLYVSSIAGKEYYFPSGAHRMFYFHSYAGLAGFPKCSVTSFDTIFCATEQQYYEVNNLIGREENKKILKAGYPKLDLLVDRFNVKGFVKGSSFVKTVIYCPTYLSEKIYNNLGNVDKADIIIDHLIDSGFKVIFRPHPQTLKHGLHTDVISIVMNKYRLDDRFSFDKSIDYYQSYVDADCMLSDVSGTSINFRFGFNKPVVFYVEDKTKAESALQNIEDVGVVTDDIDSISDCLNSSLIDFDSGDLNHQSFIYNVGTSSSYYFDYINGFLSSSKE